MKKIDYKAWRKMSPREIADGVGDTPSHWWDYVTALRGADVYLNGIVKDLFTGFLRGSALGVVDIYDAEEKVKRYNIAEADEKERMEEMFMLEVKRIPGHYWFHVYKAMYTVRNLALWGDETASLEDNMWKLVGKLEGLALMAKEGEVEERIREEFKELMGYWWELIREARRDEVA